MLCMCYFVKYLLEPVFVEFEEQVERASCCIFPSFELILQNWLGVYVNDREMGTRQSATCMKGHELMRGSFL